MSVPNSLIPPFSIKLQDYKITFVKTFVMYSILLQFFNYKKKYIKSRLKYPQEVLHKILRRYQFLRNLQYSNSYHLHCCSIGTETSTHSRVQHSTQWQLAETPHSYSSSVQLTSSSNSPLFIPQKSFKIISISIQKLSYKSNPQLCFI